MSKWRPQEGQSLTGPKSDFGQSELISALLENDEELLEAELTRKSNDELKKDLAQQSDKLLAEVRKKNKRSTRPRTMSSTAIHSCQATAHPRSRSAPSRTSHHWDRTG